MYVKFVSTRRQLTNSYIACRLCVSSRSMLENAEDYAQECSNPVIKAIWQACFENAIYCGNCFRCDLAASCACAIAYV